MEEKKFLDGLIAGMNKTSETTPNVLIGNEIT